MHGLDAAQNFLVLSLILSFLTCTLGAIRRTQLRLLFARRRRQKRRIIAILLLLKRQQQGKTWRSWSWDRQQYFFKEAFDELSP